MINADRRTKVFIRKCIAEHRESFDGDSLRDLIDIYLKAEKDGEESGGLTGMNSIH